MKIQKRNSTGSSTIEYDLDYETYSDIPSLS